MENHTIQFITCSMYPITYMSTSITNYLAVTCEIKLLCSVLWNSKILSDFLWIILRNILCIGEQTRRITPLTTNNTATSLCEVVWMILNETFGYSELYTTYQYFPVYLTAMLHITSCVSIRLIFVSPLDR